MGDSDAQSPRPRKRAKQEFRGCNWCCTLFQTNQVDEPLSLKALDLTSVVYMTWQREISPSTKKRHLQLYVVLKTRKAMASVKGLLHDPSAHVERAHGSHAQASAYCQKEDTRDPAEGSGFFTYGNIPDDTTPGKRTDLSKLKKMIDLGANEEALATEDFGAFLRHYKAFAHYRSISCKPRAAQTSLIVYWGPPGSGKSRAAAQYDNPRDTFWLPRPSGASLWWDGYASQRTLVIDEFYGWVRRDTMCRLIDRTPLRVEIKGGTVNFSSRRVIVTSNSPPEDWWKRLGLGPMERRMEDPIGVVIYVGNQRYRTESEYRVSLAEKAKLASEVGFQPNSHQISAV